jgi:hypothetical protein
VASTNTQFITEFNTKYNLYHLTKNTEESPSSEADKHSAGQEVFPLLRNLKIHKHEETSHSAKQTTSTV